jgi:hypothetical protein
MLGASRAPATQAALPAAPAPPGVAATGARADAFDRLVASWTLVNDYVVTIETMETLGTKTTHSVLEYSFRKPDRAKLEVLRGTSAGAVLVWEGGTDVTAYKRGFFSAFKLHLDIQDPRVTSLRGNGVLSPDLGEILACFSAHRSDVNVEPGPEIAGAATEAIALTYAGFTCPQDSSIDRVVTRDVLDVSIATGIAVHRERYAGSTLVESYDLQSYSVNKGLADSVFR